VWNTDTGQEAAPLRVYQAHRLVWNSSGRWVTTGYGRGPRACGTRTAGRRSLRRCNTGARSSRSRGARRKASGDSERRSDRARVGCGQRAAGDATARSQRDVTAVAWSPDGRRLATASFNGTALVWDRQGEAVTRRSRIACAFQAGVEPDGALLATASDDGVTRVWDAASGQPVTPPLAHSGDVTAVAWSPDGRHLATASADKTARVWTYGTPDAH